MSLKPSVKVFFSAFLVKTFSENFAGCFIFPGVSEISGIMLYNGNLCNFHQFEKRIYTVQHMHYSMNLTDSSCHLTSRN